MHKYLSAKCAILRPVIKDIGPLELPKPTGRSPYHSLIHSIAHQQLHGKAAESILNRFLALYDGQYPTPTQLLKTKDGAIRATGFSASKILALRDVAANAESGVIPTMAEAQKISDNELIQRLTQIRGIGKWTVEMLLIFDLGREDILPVDDFGVLNGYRIAAGMESMPGKKDFATIGEAWAPYRSLASLYFWRAADKSKEMAKAKKDAEKAATKPAAPKKPKGVKPVKMSEAEKAAAKAARVKEAEKKAAALLKAITPRGPARSAARPASRAAKPAAKPAPQLPAKAPAKPLGKKTIRIKK